METLWLCKDFWLLSWFTRCRLILCCSYALNVHVNRLEEAVRPLEKKTILFGDDGDTRTQQLDITIHQFTSVLTVFFVSLGFFHLILF